MSKLIKAVSLIYAPLVVTRILSEPLASLSFHCTIDDGAK